MSFLSKTAHRPRTYGRAMLRTTWALVLLPAAAIAGELETLTWLAGCWEMQQGALRIEEQWTRPAGGTLLGMGRTIRGDRTVFTEFLRISVVDGKLTYTARIGTPQVTPFVLSRLTGTEVVFENPTHDFPQRIVYRKTEKGLMARIEGKDKGRERHEEFPYQAAPCR